VDSWIEHECKACWALKPQVFHVVQCRQARIDTASVHKTTHHSSSVLSVLLGTRPLYQKALTCHEVLSAHTIILLKDG